jgi:phage gp45-like
MGSLKPGATYIYERDGATIYAEETKIIGVKIPSGGNDKVLLKNS